MSVLRQDVVVQEYTVIFPVEQMDSNPEIRDLFNKAVGLGLRIDAVAAVAVQQPPKVVKISGTIRQSTNTCSVCGGNFTGPHFCAGPDQGNAGHVYKMELRK